MPQTDFLERILDSIADPVFVKDRKHLWIYLNDAYCRFMGYKREALIGKSDYDFFPKEEADVFWAKDEEVFKTGKENLNEEKFTDASGVTHVLHTKKTVYTDSNGEPILVGIIRDVSAIVSSREELIRTKGFLNSIVENLPNMVFVKEARELRFVLFNRAGERLVGYKREEMIGKNDYDFFPKNEADFFTSKDRLVLKSKERLDIPEEEIKTKEGIRYLRTAKVPILDDEGNAKYLLGISEDITESKIEAGIRDEERAQMENMNRAMINREVKMTELKEEVNVLLQELKRPKKY